MDPLLIVLLGGLIALGVWAWTAHCGGPRRSPESLGLRSPDVIAARQAALEADDLDEMLAAHNARRLRRGEAAQTVEDIERLVASGARARRRPLDASDGGS